MSHCSYACILCGFRICNSSQWLREYRAIYNDLNGPSITGVGCYEGSASWIAPSNSDMRWNNIDEQDSEVEIPVMRQQPVSGRHGFVLHESCCCLLRKGCEPGPIPLEQILSICNSLSFPLHNDGIGWGHDYGNLLVREPKNYYPWYEQFSLPPNRTESFLDAQINPLEVPELLKILPRDSELPTRKVSVQTAAQDCFSRLAWEMREKIAILLPTADALSLRVACRSFVPLYSSTMFWASRFDPDGERGFLFEARDIRDAAKLVSLYRITGAKFCPAGLRNRRRIWKLIRQVTVIAKQVYADNSVYASDHELASEDWIRLSGDEQTEVSNWDLQPLLQGCRPMNSIVLSVPQGLKKIGITTIGLGSLSYVTGIRFLSEANLDARAGYMSNGNEHIYNLERLHGFRASVGIGGVRALQVIGQEGCSSNWIGHAEGVPVSDRLVHSGPIKAVKVTFDGFKMTGLAVSFQRAPMSRFLRPLPMPIRQAALWYPNIPPEELHLNEESFTGQNPLCTRYRPLLWIQFGGQRGKHLDRMVGISAGYSYGLHSLAFIYDDDESCGMVPPSQLGCDDPEELTKNPRFEIKGSAGERVTSIQVGIQQEQDPRAYDFLKHGFLKGIKMTTNFGRVFEIGTLCDPVQLQSLRILKSHTITGLYSSHDVECGLISLGVISEML